MVAGGDCHVKASLEENVLEWDPPSCEGWQDIQYYTVMYGNKSSIETEHHVTYAQDILNGTSIVIMATNVCQETTVISNISGKCNVAYRRGSLRPCTL